MRSECGPGRRGRCGDRGRICGDSRPLLCAHVSGRFNDSLNRPFESLPHNVVIPNEVRNLLCARAQIPRRHLRRGSSRWRNRSRSGKQRCQPAPQRPPLLHLLFIFLPRSSRHIPRRCSSHHCLSFSARCAMFKIIHSQRCVVIPSEARNLLSPHLIVSSPAGAIYSTASPLCPLW